VCTDLEDHNWERKEKGNLQWGGKGRKYRVYFFGPGKSGGLEKKKEKPQKKAKI